MNIEYEIKILGISKDDALKSISKLNLTKHPEILFKRYIYQIPNQPDAWIRLRSDGNKTALTYKNFKSDSIDGMQEIEVSVDSLEVANELLEAIGFKASKYQENKRLLFTNDEIEISIDEWPKIPPYIEIEGKNLKIVEEYISKLGFKDKQQTSKPTSAIYEMNGLDIDSYTRLTF